MLGDTSRIRALADDLRERAEDIRSLTDLLVTSAEQVPWDGLAAAAMRHHVGDRAAALRRTALLHEDAAEALDRHAGRVDWLADSVDTVAGYLDALPGIG